MRRKFTDLMKAIDLCRHSDGAGGAAGAASSTGSNGTGANPAAAGQASFSAGQKEEGRNAAVGKLNTQQRGAANANAAITGTSITGTVITGTSTDASAAQTGAGSSAGTAKPSFDELLRDPDYRRAYGEKVQAAVQGRFKKAQAAEERLQRAEHLFEKMGAKYGIKPGEDGRYDLDALDRASDADESYFQAEATERGIPVSELRRMKGLERDNAELQRRIADAEKQNTRRETYRKLLEGEAETKKLFPNFSLDAEMQNPEFQRLVLGAGVPVPIAFRVIHNDEIMPAAMQYAAKRSAADAASTIAAAGSRPRENAAKSSGGAANPLDPASLSPEQRRAIREAVKRGEKISF